MIYCNYFSIMMYLLLKSIVCNQLMILNVKGTSHCPFHYIYTTNNNASFTSTTHTTHWSQPLWTGLNVFRLSIIDLFTQMLDVPPQYITHTTRWSFQELSHIESNWTEEEHWKIKLKRLWLEIKTSPPISNQYPTIAQFFFRLILLGDDFTRLRLPLTFRPYANTQKVLHSGGSFARISFHWTDNEFRKRNTGLFSEDIIEGIMSGSGGNPYVGNQSAAYGWGFKFFRTNQTSATILTLNAFLGGGAYWNTFGYLTCNHASIAEMSVLAPTLLGWSRFPNQNGLSHMATYNLKGDKTTIPIFPYALCFIPNNHIKNRIGDPSIQSPLAIMHNQLRLINVNETIFSIVAIFHPKVLEFPYLLKDLKYSRIVGHVILRSPFRRSQFGDSRLFFQHQPFDDDLTFRPDWLPYMTVRNMIKEGAIGVYRQLYEPGSPSLQHQLLALNTLSNVIIKLFSDPIHQIPNILKESGIIHLPELYEFRLRQHGSSTWHILLNYRDSWNILPKNLTNIMLPTINQTNQSSFKNSLLYQLHYFQCHQLNTYSTEEHCINELNQNFNTLSLCLQLQKPNASAIQQHCQISIGPQYTPTPNDWPNSVPIQFITEDSFMNSWYRFLLLTQFLQNQYKQNTVISSNIIKDLKKINFNIATGSFLNTIPNTAIIVLNHLKSYISMGQRLIHSTYPLRQIETDSLNNGHIYNNSYIIPSTDLYANGLNEYINIGSFESDPINENNYHTQKDKKNKLEHDQTNKKPFIRQHTNQTRITLSDLSEALRRLSLILESSGIHFTPPHEWTTSEEHSHTIKKKRNDIGVNKKQLKEHYLNTIDKKILIIHLIEPIFWKTYTIENVNKDKLFETLIHQVLKTSFQC